MKYQVKIAYLAVMIILIIPLVFVATPFKVTVNASNEEGIPSIEKGKITEINATSNIIYAYVDYDPYMHINSSCGVIPLYHYRYGSYLHTELIDRLQKLLSYDSLSLTNYTSESEQEKFIQQINSSLMEKGVDRYEIHHIKHTIIIIIPRNNVHDALVAVENVTRNNKAVASSVIIIYGTLREYFNKTSWANWTSDISELLVAKSKEYTQKYGIRIGLSSGYTLWKLPNIIVYALEDREIPDNVLEEISEDLVTSLQDRVGCKAFAIEYVGVMKTADDVRIYDYRGIVAVAVILVVLLSLAVLVKTHVGR